MSRCTDIRSSALTGERACNCCAAAARAGAARLGQLVLSAISQIVEGNGIALDEGRRDELFVSASGFTATVPSFAPRILPFTETAPLPGGGAMGAAVVLVAFEIARDLSQRDGTLELASALANAIPPLVAVATKQAEGSCQSCVRRSLWGQTKPRVRETRSGNFRSP